MIGMVARGGAICEAKHDAGGARCSGRITEHIDAQPIHAKFTHPVYRLQRSIRPGLTRFGELDAIESPILNQALSDMLFLVSGTSRSGKTLIARKVLADKQIPYLSLDWLMMGFNDGIPEFGIHHLLWPNEIAEKMWPFLLGVIDCMLVDGMDYVIEGEAMLPRLVAELVEKHPDRIKVVFVGYTEINVTDKVALVKKHGGGDNDWLTNESDEYIGDHIGNMIAYSRMIKNDCENHGLPYFDTSDDFSGAIEDATDFLVGDLN